MLDPQLLNKAWLEMTRLNRELHQLHLDEERCKLKRSRLEVDKARVQSLVDMCELALRLTGKPTMPSSFEFQGVQFHTEDVHGATMLIVDKPHPDSITAQRARAAQATAEKPQVPAPPTRHKPEGLPTMPAMIAGMLKEAGKPARPSEIAAYIRGKWWAELPSKNVYTNAYRMFKDGRLTHADGRYSLAGVSLNGKGLL
jgi:hypothetical protein